MTPQAWAMFPPDIFRKAHIAYIRGGVCPGLPLPSMGQDWAGMAARVGWQLASIAARMGLAFWTRGLAMERHCRTCVSAIVSHGSNFSAMAPIFSAMAQVFSAMAHLFSAMTHIF